MNDYDLSALIPIVGGIYFFLMGIGVLPRNPTDPEKLELWRRKFGPAMKLIGPAVCIFGILQFFRIL